MAESNFPATLVPSAGISWWILKIPRCPSTTSRRAIAGTMNKLHHELSRKSGQVSRLVKDLVPKTFPRPTPQERGNNNCGR